MPTVDVILPCLDEIEALPWVIGRITGVASLRAIVVDNGSTDGSADLARQLGATVVRCDERGYGAACHAGLLAATAELVAFCDCDASIDPRDALRLAHRLEVDADLVVARRVATTRHAFPPRARWANRSLARQVPSENRAVRADRSRSAACRAPSRPALAEPHRPAVGVPGRDRRPRRRPGVAGRAGGRPVPASQGALEGVRTSRREPGGGARRTPSTGPMSRLDPTAGRCRRALVVLAKRPVPGRVKTRLSPDVSPVVAAELAAAALRDTLDVASTATFDARVLSFAGSVRGWLRPGWTHHVQPDGGLDVRIAAALRTDGSPTLLVGMDTPQLDAGLLQTFDPVHFDACLGPTADGGYWAIGLRETAAAADAVIGVPMSTPHTFADQHDRLRGLGMSVQILPGLTDVDLIGDARAGRGARTAHALRPGHVTGRPGGRGMRTDPLGPYERALELRTPLWMWREDGRAIALEIDRWRADADDTDLEVVRRSRSPVLDVGCGPGPHRRRADRARPPRSRHRRLAPCGLDDAWPRAQRPAARCVRPRCPASAGGARSSSSTVSIGIGGDLRSLLASCATCSPRTVELVIETHPDARPTRVGVGAARYAGAAARARVRMDLDRFGRVARTRAGLRPRRRRDVVACRAHPS